MKKVLTYLKQFDDSITIECGIVTDPGGYNCEILLKVKGSCVYRTRLVSFKDIDYLLHSINVKNNILREIEYNKLEELSSRKFEIYDDKDFDELESLIRYTFRQEEIREKMNKLKPNKYKNEESIKTLK